MEIGQAHTQGIFSDLAWTRLGDLNPDLVLIFGSLEHFQPPGFPTSLRAVFPVATLLGCSTAGEIVREEALEAHVVLTALKLQHPAFRAATVP
jgi:hypothetical protein